MHARKLLFAAAAVMVSGCATSYQVDGFTGGQAPKWRATDVLEVQASGNAFTKDSNLGEMTLLRAAESAIAANFRYFIEIGSQNSGRTETAYLPQTSSTTFSVYPGAGGLHGQSSTLYGGGPVTFYKPGVNAVYRMFDELPADARPGQFHDAFEVYNRLGPKYIRGFRAR
jgi:hypothetical protein